MHIIRTGTPALIAAFWLSMTASATVVPRMDLHSLTHSAGAIVHGRVLRHWSAWDASHRYIWTHYAVQIDDRLKGSTTDTTVISEPGGVVDGLAMKVAGVPEYRDGEEVVLFLHSTPAGYLRCYGLAQGKFTVTRDSGGQKRVHTDLRGITRTDLPGKSIPRLRAASASIESLNGSTLEQFKQCILRELRQQ